jgi:pimeloyl-ACP methyl ester carboxylesterase
MVRAARGGQHGGVPDLATDLVVHVHGRPLGEAPTLLFLHGLTDSGRGWPEAVRHWGERFSIVSYDARGHGESPRFTPEQLDGHPGEVMVDDAVRLLEQLDRPVVVGHSLGGAVALAAATRRPDLVRGVVLEDPAPRGPDEPQQSGRGEEFLEGVRDSLAAPDEETLYAQRKAQHPGWPDSELLVTGVAEQQMDTDYLGRGDYKPATPWSELYAEVRLPTLVITGDDPDEILVSEEVEQAITTIGNPQVTLVRIAGAGHCIRRDQPEAFYSTVDDWLSRLG